jgi:hypothetical protein
MNLLDLNHNCLLHITSFMRPQHLQVLSLTSQFAKSILDRDAFWSMQLSIHLPNGISATTGGYKDIVLKYVAQACFICLLSPGKLHMEDINGRVIKSLCKECKNEDNLITKTVAKSTWKVNDSDLAKLPALIQRNPHCRSAASMQLFFKDDIKQLSLAKHGEEGLAKKLERSKNLKMKKETAKDTRKASLVEALQAQGLTLRSDSRLCEQYISNGKGNLSKIVDIMAEMKFYHEKTDYCDILDSEIDLEKSSGYRYDIEECKDAARQKALKKWLQNNNNPERWDDSVPPSIRKSAEQILGSIRRETQKRKVQDELSREQKRQKCSHANSNNNIKNNN